MLPLQCAFDWGGPIGLEIHFDWMAGPVPWDGSSLGIPLVSTKATADYGDQTIAMRSVSDALGPTPDRAALNVDRNRSRGV